MGGGSSHKKAKNEKRHKMVLNERPVQRKPASLAPNCQIKKVFPPLADIT